MRHELVIRDEEDILMAREILRKLARQVGCDAVQEARLVAGLSDLAERFYLKGRDGMLVLEFDGVRLEAALVHGPVGIGSRRAPERSLTLEAPRGTCDPVPTDDYPVAILGAVRFMWDEVTVDSCEGMTRVVLRSWLSR